LLHPLAKQNSRVLILDGSLHALVEQDLPLSARKFLVYNLPQLVSQLAGEDSKAGKVTEKLIRETIKLARSWRTFQKRLKRLGKTAE